MSSNHPNRFLNTIKNNIDPKEATLSLSEINVLKHICNEDLYLFAIRYFSHYLKKPSSKFHKFLYELIPKKLNAPNRKEGIKYAIAAPRGAAKSSILSLIVPLWCMAYEKKKFIVIISDTAKKAEGFLADIKRELRFNAKLSRDFPDLVGKGRIWRANQIETSNSITVLALGTGNNIRGERISTDRPDLVLGDDLENSEMLRSRSQREFIRFQWFNKDVLPVGGEEGTCTDFIIVGTVLGKDSLLNALLDIKEYPEWESKRFAAVLEFSTSPLWHTWAELYKNRFNENRKQDAYNFFKQNEEDMLRGTEVLWPEGEPYYKLMLHQLSDPSGFITEKMNSNVDTTRIMITEEQLRWENFLLDPVIIKVVKSKQNPIFGALDPSLGKKATIGDFSCIITIMRDLRTGYLFVLDIDISRRSVEDQIEAVIFNHETYNYRAFAVETNAFQQVIADNIRTVSKITGAYVPIIEMPNYSDKKMRIEGIIPFLADGTVIFDKYKYDNNQEYRLGVEQICTFTGENDRHDDCPDSLEMCMRVAKKPKFKTLTKRNK